MRVVIVAALLLSSAICFAQSDAQLWLESGIKVEVVDDLDAVGALNLRLFDDVSSVESVFPEVGLRWRAKRWLRLATGFRWSYRRTGSGDFEGRPRVHFDLSLRRKLADFRVDYRVRYQEAFRPGENRHTLRNRAGASYRGFDAVDPFASLEVFHRIGDGDSIRLWRYRIDIGGEFQVGRESIELFYRLELPQNDNNDPTAHIIGLSAYYEP